MTADNIIYWIDLVVEPEEFNRREINMIKRYFIRKLIPWLPLRVIAEMTGATHHSSVLHSIKKVKADHKFQYVLPTVQMFLDDICETLKYTPKP
jgi:hypothetical protein